MTDADGDGVYSITLERAIGFSTNYTFINGLCPSGWGCKENIVGQLCADVAHYNDRFLPYLREDVVLDACFGYCSETGLCEVEQAFSVTFNLDTRNLADPGLFYIAGNTINGWSAHQNPLVDVDSDGIYSATIRLGAGEHLYKFVHDKNWEDLADISECTITDSSGLYTNRYVIVQDQDLILDAILFGECGGYVSTDELVTEEDYTTVYPTIADDYINVNVQSRESSSQVYIYSMAGQIMTEQSLTTNYQHRVDVSSYSSGTYLVTVQTGRQLESHRFIKM